MVDEPSPKTVALKARSRATTRGTGFISNSLMPDEMPVVQTGIRPTMLQRVEQDPVAIRNAARDLVTAINEQIAQLAPRNDPDTRDFIDFLTWVVGQLNALITALDQLIAAAPEQQPMFLGGVGKVVEQLKIGTFEYLEPHRAAIMGRAFNFGLSIIALKFAALFGLDIDTIVKLFKP
jgi:hypothetical protein